MSQVLGIGSLKPERARCHTATACLIRRPKQKAGSTGCGMRDRLPEAGLCLDPLSREKSPGQEDPHCIPNGLAAFPVPRPQNNSTVHASRV